MGDTDMQEEKREWFQDSRDAWQALIKEDPDLIVEVKQKLVAAMFEDGFTGNPCDDDEYLDFLVEKGAVVPDSEALSEWITTDWLDAIVRVDLDNVYLAELFEGIDQTYVWYSQNKAFFHFELSNDQIFVVANMW